MLQLLPKVPRGRPLRLLLIGAHCDDIEIGCGGTVCELLERYPDAEVDWVVLSSDRARAAEARRAARLLMGTGKGRRVSLQRFRNSFFPAYSQKIKEWFEGLKKISPDIVFAHYRDDLHQDHRMIGELVWNTFRDHLVLEYEIPKYDGGLGSPNVFVPLKRATVNRKIDTLMQVFGSQRSKSWFTEDTFSALMRLRGVECNAKEGFAEAFYGRKLFL
jgi:LmbE family N-acetylglucosaminyl deacetylase